MSHFYNLFAKTRLLIYTLVKYNISKYFSVMLHLFTDLTLFLNFLINFQMKKLLLQKTLILLILANLCTSAIFAQNTKLWNPLTRSEVENTKPKAGFEWKNINLINISRKTLSSDLSVAPKESTASRSENSNFILDLPSPTGESVQFQLVESALLTLESAAAFPFIKTYRGSEVGNPRNTLHLTVSHLGIHALILRNGETFYIRPYELNGSDEHIVFNKKDEIVPKNTSCGTETGSIQEELQDISGGARAVSDCQLRTYRIAVAATGEYVVWAGSQANAAAQITATINDVEAIYEVEATIAFTLVLSNSILFTNAATDPYTISGTSNTTLTTNHTTIVNAIGSANFDLGHLFSNDWNGGLATTPSVCSNSSKGNAQSGLNTSLFPSGPTGSIMEATVAHEIAHQFSVSHTMSSLGGGCLGNVATATAVEPGGGSTLMAYAGVCSGNSYQSQSDPYFHTVSLTQLTNYAISQSTCGAISSAANTAPVIATATATYNIPSGTPFLLNVNASDVNGDALTYTFEQTDPISAGTTSNPTSTLTSGPVFRSYPPSAANFRYFPNLSNILANTTPPFEVLPTVARALTFRSVVRDNRSGGSCSAEVPFTVNTIGTTPFRVSSQNTATSLTANGSNTFTITWDVAATTAAPVSCANVKISFSTDGGNTFPNVLLASTANDGTETIVIPNFPTTIGRIKVESIGNIFFDINDANVTITTSVGCIAAAGSIAPTTAVVGTVGNASLDLFLAPQYTAQYTSISGSLTSSDPLSSLSVVDVTAPTCVNYSNTTTYEIYSIQVSVGGTYTFNKGSNGSVISLYSGSYSPSSPCTNFMNSGTVNGSIGSSVSATLNSGTTYTLLISTFDVGVPALPFSYTINITAPSGGAVSSAPGVPNPGASYNYTYVAVNTATNTIVAINASSDLTALPTGQYSVYGLSYLNSISTATLNTYISGAFSNLQTAILNATICASLSSNSVSVTINCASAPAVTITNNNGLNIGCAPTSTTLTASSTGATSYLWSTNATTAAITVSGAGGIFQVTTTDGSGCKGVGNATVNYSTALPIAVITSNNGLALGCIAPSTTLTATGGVSYLWNGSGGAANAVIASVINTTYTVTVTGATGCTAKTSVTTYQQNALGATVAPTTIVSAVVNSPSLDLSLAPVYATPMTTPITGTLTTSNSASTLAVFNTTTSGCINFSNATKYQTYSFQVNNGGIYTFDKGLNNLVISLYNGSFNSASPCTNLINSGTTNTGSGGSTIGTAVSATLNPGTTYVLLVSSFSATTPTLPLAYSVSVTAPSGGAIYPIPGSINPGASYNYTYVMVKGTTIAAINSNSDLSGINTVGTYNVYGLSYHNSISATTLNGYINGTLAAMQTAMATNALCANLSTNNVVVEINCSTSTYNLPTSNATTSLAEDCTSNGWTGYSSAGNLMFAVEWQPTGSSYNNNAAKTAAVVSATLDAANGSASNATDATFTMKRYWNVNLGATPLAGPVNVRFFYSAAEKTATTSQGTAYATANGLANETPTWFKTVGTAFNPSTGLVVKGVQNAILLTDVNAGAAATINGVLYAQFNGVASFSGGTFAAGVGSATPLPVTLSSFTGNKIGEKVALRWITESEQNTRDFTLEKSIDGINFSDLTTVFAAKNTNKTAKYEFIDNTPFNGNNYYRLKTNDLDGSSRYDGSIIVVNMERNGLVKLFPNPTTGKMTIQLHSETEIDTRLRIFNVLGEAVKDLSLTFSKGENWLPVDVSELPNGTYFLDMGQGEKSFFVVSK